MRPIAQNRVGGWFFCDTNREEFRRLNGNVQLVPGKTQNWILLFNSTATQADVERNALMTLRQIFKDNASLFCKLMGGECTEAFVPFGVDSFKLDSWQAGPPASIQQDATVVQGAPLSQLLPTNKIYARVRFVYSGRLTEMPWPWAARGFVIQCPEDPLYGLVAALPVTEPPPPSEQTQGNGWFQNPLTGVEEAISNAAAVLLWGGVGIILWQVLKASSTVRERVA